ncbi:MAG: hydroxymethylpyrimidine/phosphomethylpyrimidine kinase [Candidatus Fonsibacter sp.]
MRFATLVTPNIPEAERLTGVKIFKLKDMVKAGKEILKLGAVYVLIKGGHMKGSKIQNILITKKLVKIFISKKIKTKHTHGTGCTLSSAIASYLSRGYSIEKACDSSINYVYKAIEQYPGFGKGHGPVNHVALLK